MDSLERVSHAKTAALQLIAARTNVLEVGFATYSEELLRTFAEAVTGGWIYEFVEVLTLIASGRVYASTANSDAEDSLEVLHRFEQVLDECIAAGNIADFPIRPGLTRSGDTTLGDA